VDAALYSPGKKSGSQRAFTVGTVAANTTRKKFGRMIDAFSLFKQERPEAGLIIKTDRPVSHDEFDLPRYARLKKMSGCIRIVYGKYDVVEMRDLYRSMDLYLNLSEWERFCIPVIEAMACGVPVACQPIQGPGELVPYEELLIGGGERRYEGETLLIEPDPRRAAEMLSKACADRALLERLADAGREKVMEHYRIESVARRWLELVSALREP
jgi:glycosyltransferase involved in cell wall biosynthesis